MFSFSQRGVPPMDVVDKDTNQPHLLRFVDEDLPSQYFIAIEQVIHVEVNSLVKGLYTLVALHYVYDMEYNARLKDFFMFLEDKILSIANTSIKKSVSYSSVTAAIECYIP